MKRAGYTLTEMAFVLKHKNLESLKYYLEKPTLEDKTNFSNSLFNENGQNNENIQNDSDSDFEEPPRPPKLPKKIQSVVKRQPTSTVSKAPIETGLDIEVQKNENDGRPTNSQNNILQRYKQNPIGMFVGANLSNCTININMPK